MIAIYLHKHKFGRACNCFKKFYKKVLRPKEFKNHLEFIKLWGPVPWLNKLICHLRDLATNIGAGSCPAYYTSQPAPCLWMVQSLGKLDPHGLDLKEASDCWVSNLLSSGFCGHWGRESAVRRSSLCFSFYP